MPHVRSVQHPLSKDLTGRRFGQLVVTGPSEDRHNGRRTWSCRCDCGAVKSYRTSFLTRGEAISCGCYGRSRLGSATRKHGQSGTRAYRIWVLMVHRCTKRDSAMYPPYGGRGIRVCERWRKSFTDFLADVGHPPGPKHTIDRIDNNGHYEPGNCRWATPTTQARNRRTSRLLTHNGKTQTVAEWAAETGIQSRTIRARIDVSGWSVAEALTTPV